MKKMKKIALLLAVVILFGVAVGGTLAWLTDKTTPVTNTFTTSDVDIELTEKNEQNDETPNANEYQMIPGYTITKDPKVTVKAVSEKCYVFVKVDPSENFGSFMEYTMDTVWTKLELGDGETLKEGDNIDNVYYLIADDTDADQTFAVIAGNTVTVNDTVTKAAMNALTADTYPTLNVTAYACQYNKNNTDAFTAYEAWVNVPKE